MLFAIFRFTIRLYALKKLLLDDVAVVVALLLLLSLAVMYRYATPIMFELDRIARGAETLTPAFLPRAAVFLKLQFAIIVLFWTTIWVVKISFLIFYRALFMGLPEHMLMVACVWLYGHRIPVMLGISTSVLYSHTSLFCSR